MLFLYYKPWLTWHILVIINGKTGWVLMYYNREHKSKINVYEQSEGEQARYLNTEDINISSGYKIEVFAEGLNSPSSIIFTEDGDLLLADSGYITGNPSIFRLVDDRFDLIADGFNVPLTGINWRDGNIYVSHRGKITILHEDGTRIDVIKGLPSYGDYSNSRVDFGADNKMYFALGTATNSGVVGTDNLWVDEYPLFHDNPGSYILLVGQNFATNNILLEGASETIYTGAFSAYGQANGHPEVRKGVVKASGSILRANPDGTDLELVAWGLRSPSYLRFDEGNRLFVANNGCDIRGSRPIANAPDELLIINEGIWYGWPDYVGGEPVTLDRFRPSNGPKPEFLLMHHPNYPPRPFVVFPPESNIIGFDFSFDFSFGLLGSVYIAEFGSVMPRTYGQITQQFAGAGHRITQIDISTGSSSTFAINKSGFSASLTREGGFGRPMDISFGPDGAMYVVDMGLNYIEDPNAFIPNTGVIWRISRIV